MTRTKKAWVALALGTLGTLLSMGVGLVALRQLRGGLPQPCMISPTIASPGNSSRPDVRHVRQ
jgi:uncharacterized membrane protein